MTGLCLALNSVEYESNVTRGCTVIVLLHSVSKVTEAKTNVLLSDCRGHNQQLQCEMCFVYKYKRLSRIITVETSCEELGGGGGKGLKGQ